MAINPAEVASFVAMTNELMRRYNEHITKEAHYKDIVQSLGPQIAKKLYELGALDQEARDNFVENLSKSAAAPLELLDTLTDHLSNMPSVDMGTPLTYQPNGKRVAGGTKNTVQYGDFVYDASKYL